MGDPEKAIVHKNIRKKIDLKNEIIEYIKNYQKNSKTPPSISSCLNDFKSKYSTKIIEATIWDLIDKGILKYFSFHAYLVLET